MDQNDDLELKRAALYEAQSLFKREPTPLSRDAYKAASAAFNLALHHAGKSSEADDAESGDLITAKPNSHLPQADQEAIHAARQKANVAFQEMYANPSPQAKQEWMNAKNEYKRLQNKLDPVFRAKRAESTRRSVEKRKLGLTATPWGKGK